MLSYEMKIEICQVEGLNLLITRETDYALRILRTLSDGQHITTEGICKRELLPQQFVYKILKKMERAGYVQITRGTDGGCRLIADLNSKSLYDLIEVMEAEKRISSCMQPGFVCEWRLSHGTRCTVHNRLMQIQSVLDTELRKHSLHQMLFDED